MNNKYKEKASCYFHDLQMYKIPPHGLTSLTEFQNMALERQKILQLLELTLAQEHKTVHETKKAFLDFLNKEGCTHYIKLINATGCASHTEVDLERRKRDHISHFILRLAYSEQDMFQNYFLFLETELFKLRYDSLNYEGFTQFLHNSDIHYSIMPSEFKNANKEYLFPSTAKNIDYENTHFYELPFEEVSDLIREQKVFLRNGMAYIPESDFLSVFVAHFKRNLAAKFNEARNIYLRSMDDDRLHSLFKTLINNNPSLLNISWLPKNVPLSKISELSIVSYPPCMRLMHEHLTTTHHLRNTGRLQYGIFLKSIGVAYEDSIEFWKTELTKKRDCNEEKFNKQYLYHIKYIYGKVGRKINYSPHSCTKLLNEPIGPGEVHGCPFQNMDHDELSKMLISHMIIETDIEEIVQLSSEGQCRLACLKYFESTHKQRPEKSINFPNSYFIESQKINELPL